MVKVPAAGRVKTRLAREVGVVGATSFYRHTASAVVGRLARDPRWQTILAVSPDTALATRSWPLSIPRRRQGGGDLGRRMQRVMDELAPGPAIIVGTDIPGIRANHVAAAFRALGKQPAVLGPAGDGGYWLVGLRRRPRVPRAFRAVRWSSEHALTDTAGNFAMAELAYAATLNDVDRSGELQACRPWCGRRVLPPG